MWTFVMAMILYPDVQKAAQSEIDRVIGPDRLPELIDRESLPYVTAAMREGLRLAVWRFALLTILTCLFVDGTPSPRLVGPCVTRMSEGTNLFLS